MNGDMIYGSGYLYALVCIDISNLCNKILKHLIFFDTVFSNIFLNPPFRFKKSVKIVAYILLKLNINKFYIENIYEKFGYHNSKGANRYNINKSSIITV